MAFMFMSTWIYISKTLAEPPINLGRDNGSALLKSCLKSNTASIDYLQVQGLTWYLVTSDKLGRKVVLINHVESLSYNNIRYVAIVM